MSGSDGTRKTTKDQDAMRVICIFAAALMGIGIVAALVSLLVHVTILGVDL